MAKDCTVKNIERVNIRFKVANTLRLANDSIATTKGGPNNIVFELVTEDSSSSTGGGSFFPAAEKAAEVWMRIRWDSH